MSSGLRPSVSIVIPAWNAWEHTRACLESLRGTVGPQDQVVVVDNGSVDETPDGLGAFPWAEVVTNRENRGFAGGCNQGAARARGDVVVFLNSDTVLPPGWLEELVAPFGDPEVGACGPRSDNVSGWQSVPGVPWDPAEPGRFLGFAAAWRERHRGRTTQVQRLVGFCLAVRRTTLESLGGFDERFEIGGYEDDDLCRRITALGLRLLIADGSLIHHACHASFDANRVDWVGHELANRSRYEEKWAAGTASPRPDVSAPAPLLSACLIVKDEEEMLPACLESIRDAVDEIVVYDTGSTDRTVAVARAAGAVVVEGTWHDDFARARNAALAHATGEWVLSIDADETLQADPAALRRQLTEVGEEIEVFLTAIENLFGAGKARTVHTAIRVFRRTVSVWRHRVHEQVTPSDDPGRTFSCSFLSSARLLHHGYAADVFAGRDKAARNLELARAAMEDGEVSHPYATMNYGRALESAGRSEDAVGYLLASAEATDDPIIKRLAVVNLIAILTKLERYDEALAQIARMRRLSRSQVAADIAEGRCRIAMGETVEGLAILSRLPVDARDDDGMEYRPHMLAAIRGEALASLGRYSEAADVVLEAVRTDGVLEADLGELVDWLIRAGRSPTEVTTGLRVEDLVTVLGRAMRQPPVLADLLLEGAFESFPARMEPLAAAARVAPALPVARALVWSARLRSRGLPDACPLVAIAGDPDVEPEVRVRAAAAAWGSFGPDDRLVGPVRGALDSLGPDRRSRSEEEMGRLAPGLAAVLDAPNAPAVSSTPATGTATTPAPGTADSTRRTVPGPSAPRTAPSPGPGARTTSARPATRRVVTVPVAEHPRRGGVNIVGPFEGTGREADVARALARALREEGTEVSTTSYHRETRDATVDFEHRDAGDYPYDVNLLIIHPDDLTDFVLDYGADSFEGRYVVGLWLWDLEAPSTCMPDSSRMAHEVWVPTRAGAVTARAAGVSSAHVVPLPTGPVPTGWDRAGLGLPEGTVFSCRVDYDTGVERQNPRGALDAFMRAFAPGEGPHLVVDTLHADRYPSEHAALVAAAGSRPDISFLSGSDRSPAERDAVVAHSDCFVSLHRADSCLVAVGRALAWGVPTVVTGDRATSGYPTGREAFVVPSEPVVVPDHLYRYPQGSTWSEPDVDAATAALRRVVDDPAAVESRVRRAAAEAARRHSDRQVARSVRRRLGAVDAARYGDAPAGPRGRTMARRR